MKNIKDFINEKKFDVDFFNVINGTPKKAPLNVNFNGVSYYKSIPDWKNIFKYVPGFTTLYNKKKSIFNKLILYQDTKKTSFSILLKDTDIPGRFPIVITNINNEDAEEFFTQNFDDVENIIKIAF